MPAWSTFDEVCVTVATSPPTRKFEMLKPLPVELDANNLGVASSINRDSTKLTDEADDGTLYGLSLRFTKETAFPPPLVDGSPPVSLRMLSMERCIAEEGDVGNNPKAQEKLRVNAR